jgi:sugar fermentation stimulation protein A
LPGSLIAADLGAPVTVRREVTVGSSRLDFLLEGPAGCCYIEAKSVTLVVDGIARFPDAPTTRGARHVGELIQLHEAGAHAAILFIVQREDATAFRPNVAADPPFAAALARAAAAGVETRAYRCRVTLTGVTIMSEIPVILDAG